jgi:hypothetical protein
MQEKEIIITDKARWMGGVCLYGYDEENNGIRPIMVDGANNPTSLPRNFVERIKPFQRVKFGFIRHQPSPPHTEDWVINGSYFPQIVGVLSQEERKAFLEKILFPCLKGDHWGTEICYYRKSRGEDVPCIEPGKGIRSIITIKPKSILFVRYSSSKNEEESGKSKREIMLEFSDMKGENYNLKVTDLAFEAFCDDLKGKGMDDGKIGLNLQRKLNDCEVFLRIGTGRAFTPRESDKPYCFLFITAIYSFPNYIDVSF